MINRSNLFDFVVLIACLVMLAVLPSSFAPVARTRGGVRMEPGAAVIRAVNAPSALQDSGNSPTPPISDGGGEKARCLSTIEPSSVGQKLAGFAQWSQVPYGLAHNEQGARVTISAVWPYFESNPLMFWGFPSAATAAGCTVSVHCRQSNGDLWDLAARITVYDAVAKTVTTIYPDVCTPSDGSWCDVHYVLPKAVSDWSAVTIELVATSGLTDSAEFECDCLWVE